MDMLVSLNTKNCLLWGLVKSEFVTAKIGDKCHEVLKQCVTYFFGIKARILFKEQVVRSGDISRRKDIYAVSIDHSISSN